MEKYTIKTRESYKNGVRSIESIEVEFFVNSPCRDIESVKLKEEDVWGNGKYNRETKENRGMRVAVYGEKCPIFCDIVPYKSCTVVCTIKQEDDVIYWLEYVYGCNCIVMRKELDDLRVALRAEYQCW